MSAQQTAASWDPPGARIVVAEADFDIGQELQTTRQAVGGQAGAVASFVGLVRDRFQANKVGALYLEHYPGMTEPGIAQIVRQAQARWSLLDVLVYHRVGELQPLDQIVYVQVASAHRADAFAACEYLMDYLKTDAVLWKRERRGGDNSTSERWLEATSADAERRKSWEQKAP